MNDVWVPLHQLRSAFVEAREIIVSSADLEFDILAGRPAQFPERWHDNRRLSSPGGSRGGQNADTAHGLDLLPVGKAGQQNEPTRCDQSTQRHHSITSS